MYFVKCYLWRERGVLPIRSDFTDYLERNEATDVWPLMDEHLNRLNACSQHLIDFVLPDVTLISELLSAEVITSRHKQYIDVGGTSNERNSRILEILARRSVADLKNYLQCLVKTRQGHLVPFLTRNTAVAEIRVDLNCESASIRGEIEAEIVTQLDSLLRDGCIERDEQDVDHLNQTLARLGRDAQLAAIRQVNNCLTAYVICLSTAAVEGLRKLYTGGELRSVLEEIFIGLLGFTTSIVVGGLDWSSQNYEKCLKAMLITTGWIYTPKTVVKPMSTVNYVNDLLPFEQMEKVIMKSAFLHLKYSMKMASRADNVVLTTLCSVCQLWWHTIGARRAIRRRLHKLYRLACRPYRRHPKSVPSPDVLDGGAVRGVTNLDGKLYFVCRRSDVIQVFDDRPPFARHNDLRARGLTWPHDIVACGETHRLFVTDSAKKCIFRIDPTSKDDDERVTNWTRPRHVPFALSVRRRRLLVTPNVFFSRLLVVYDCVSGDRVDGGAELPENMEPRHAVETDRGTFIVCCTIGRGSDAYDQVCEINSSGSVVRSFGGRRSDVTSGRLRVPRSLVLDADGRVLVADSGNWRAVLLDSELRLVRILLNWDVELNRLCFNAATGLLIVGFRSSTVRVYKIKN